MTRKDLEQEATLATKSQDPEELEAIATRAYTRMMFDVDLVEKGNCQAKLRWRWNDLIVRICTSRLKMLQRLRSMKTKKQRMEENSNDANAD